MAEVTSFGMAQNRRKGDAHRGATTRSRGPVEGLGTPATASKSSVSAGTYYYHGLLGRDVVKRETKPAQIEFAGGGEDTVSEIPDFVKVAAAILPRALFGTLAVVLLIGLDRRVERHAKELPSGFRVLKRVNIGSRDRPTTDGVNPDLPVPIRLRDEHAMLLKLRVCGR